MSKSVQLINPLPLMLGHYCRSLTSVLTRSDQGASVTVRSAAIERHSGRGRLSGAASLLATETQILRSKPEVCIVAWPSLGFLDWVFWRSGESTLLYIVCHDPTPLRKQHGLGKLARALGRASATARGTRTIVHSAAAASVLTEVQWPNIVQLRLPIRSVSSNVSGGTGVVGVVGQWKPSRKLALIEAVAREIRPAGYEVHVFGLGWPHIDGCRVFEGMLSEEGLDTAIRACDAILVPYSWYYQSDIAIRALEWGVPVVGHRHPFLEEVLGVDWPGLVDGNSIAGWVSAVERVTALDRGELLSRRSSFEERCVEDWRCVL